MNFSCCTTPNLLLRAVTAVNIIIHAHVNKLYCTTHICACIATNIAHVGDHTLMGQRQNTPIGILPDAPEGLEIVAVRQAATMIVRSEVIGAGVTVLVED